MNQSDLPNIPGFRISIDTRNKFHKSHLFDICNGIPITDIKRQGIVSFEPSTQPTIRKKPTATKSTTSTLPKWVIFDRKVLRFYSYFKENVFNSAIEKERIRKCIIYYFLEDDTFMINEIKIENSGIPQNGSFLKRQKIPNKLKNGYLNYLDIKINKEIEIFGRKFIIIDADKQTREYFKTTNNIDLDEAINYPKDDYIRYLEERNKSNNKLNNKLNNKSNNKLAKSKKYLANDGKVLRFNGCWKDNSFGGNIRKYVILYFLSDDTIQVLEFDQNDKKGEKLISLLKRDKLPKDYSLNDDNYYTHNELRIGAYINIYGRQVLLTSCDKFTKNFYINIYGLKDPQDFKEIIINDNNDNNNKSPIKSSSNKQQQEPIKDYAKIAKYDGYCLRFLAKLNEKSTQIENYQRRFVILYHLSDDTIQIYEKPYKNSGFISGKFLERTKLRNHSKPNSPWFHAEDFYLNATVKINGFTFDLIETDKQTNDIINNNLEIFTRNSPQQILKALADKLWNRSKRQTSTFRFIDENKDRLISPNELKNLCSKYGWNLNPNQLKVLFNYFDTDKSGTIEIAEFFNALTAYKLQQHVYPQKA